MSTKRSFPAEGRVNALPYPTLVASAVIVFFRETFHAALLHLSQMQLVIMQARDQLLEGRNTEREANAR